jgi:hypothetical protein
MPSGHNGHERRSVVRYFVLILVRKAILAYQHGDTFIRLVVTHGLLRLERLGRGEGVRIHE